MFSIKLYLVLAVMTAGFQISAADKSVIQRANRVYDDIHKTFGFVPQFLDKMPTEALPGAWADMKAIQFSTENGLTRKEKELIGLAVAAQIPCPSCTFYHTEFAKLSGASDKEIRESVSVAALSRKLNAILLVSQANLPTFRSDTDRIINFRKSQTGNSSSTLSKDTASAMEDMKKTWGFVPEFLTRYPPSALPGIWNEIKNLLISDNTTLRPKLKNLIGLAVSVQAPSRGYIYFYAQSAQQDGATPLEITQATAMSAGTIHLSTLLNGMQINEVQFQSEVRQMIENIKSPVRLQNAAK